MSNKFTSVLQKKANEIKREEEQQRRLQEKYQVDPTVKVVETNMFWRSLADMVGRILRMLFQIIIFGLALSGAIGLVYPAPREELLKVYLDIWNQILTIF